jgi:molecular chaperone GrpE
MDKDEKKKEKKHEEEQEIFEEETKSNDELDSLTDQLQECEAKYKRALADYQNLEKRTRDERSEWIRASSRELLLRLLPVLDTLSLANKHIENQGLQVTLQQFLDVLRGEGVTKIETLGKKFDPHLMEAIQVEEGGDVVIEEVREGYMLYDKLLRPAQVRVGKK